VQDEPVNHQSLGAFFRPDGRPPQPASHRQLTQPAPSSQPDQQAADSLLPTAALEQWDVALKSLDSVATEAKLIRETLLAARAGHSHPTAVDTFAGRLRVLASTVNEANEALNAVARAVFAKSPWSPTEDAMAKWLSFMAVSLRGVQKEAGMLAATALVFVDPAGGLPDLISAICDRHQSWLDQMQFACDLVNEHVAPRTR